MARIFASALIMFLSSLVAVADQTDAQPAIVTPGENLVLERIPPIPTKIGEDTARYGESREATLFGWHPQRREILIGTRFGDTAQVHSVVLPGGMRRQLTFFSDPVLGAQYLPDGKSFVFQKDSGGGEWYQIYRYDLTSGDFKLLTDGHSRNERYLLAHHSTKLVYTSTRRNNKDDDLWIVDAAESKNGTARMLMRVDGGGWAPVAWSSDNRQLLVRQQISANESYLWLVDATSGERKLLTPRPFSDKPDATVSYSAAAFSKDNKSLYVLTDRDNEFRRLARIDLKSLQPTYLTSSIPWDVEKMAACEDGSSIAFVTNENGYSKLYLLDIASSTFRELPHIPEGVMDAAYFRANSRELGFTITSARSPPDVYSIDTATGKLDRWTRGETGGLNPIHFVQPTVVKWKSFDGRELSGFIYQPDAARFRGKRPVIVSVHGGPESQFRPTYRAQDNYLIDKLGVAIVAPNVRGSSGYGKTFLKLDNGFQRDGAYKDIAALLDWVKAQPQLDSSRVMIYGDSYGGHVSWAMSAFYNERIRCAMPIVGAPNLVTFLERTEAYRQDLRRVEYGDERDPAMRAYLETIAPINHIDAMHKPIFAVVGKNDPRVPWTESRQIIDKLNAQGTPTWFMMAADEGHVFAKKSTLDFLFDAEVLFVERCLIADKAF